MRPLFLVILFLNFLFAQKIELTNQGDTLTIQNGGVLYVEGGLWNQATGEIYNDGTLYIQDTIKHDANNKMFIDALPAGQAIVGTTVLNGGIQRILGNSPIYFDTLLLRGTNKKILEQNAFVEHFLDLENKEFATQTHLLTVTNPDVNSVSRQNGFVSSEKGGYLVRNTNSSGVYLFPTGASAPTFRYRPVEIIPANASTNQFAVRLANTDPTSEGLNRNQKVDSLGEINPLYYHQIKQTQGNANADIHIYYDSSDPYTETIAQWKNLWTDIGSFGVNDPTNSRWILKNWNDYNSENFAFAMRIIKYSLFVPNVFSPNGDGTNDEFYPVTLGVENIVINVYDRWGNLLWEGRDSQHWDGTYNGQPVPEGVYVYVITGQVKRSGKKITRTGSLTVLR